MEENYNEIDDLLKEKFADHTMEPSKELWTKVAVKLASRSVVSFQKYRKLKIAMYGSAATFTGVILVLLASHFNLFQPIQEAEVLCSPSKNENKIEESTTNEETPTTIKPSNKALEIVIPTKKENTVIRSNKIEENENIANTNFQFINSNKASNNERVESQLQENTPLSNSPALADVSTMNAKTRNTNSGTSETPSNENSQLAVINQQTNRIEEIIPSKVLVEMKNKKEELNSDLLEPQQNNVANNQITNDIISPTKASKSHLKQLEWEFFGSPQYASHNIDNGNQNQQINADGQFKDDLNDAAFTWCAGALVNVPLSKNFYISTGISFSQYKQQMILNRDNFIALNNNQYSFNSSAGILQLDYSGDNILTNPDIIRSNLNFSYVEIPLSTVFQLNEKYSLEGGLFYRRLMNTGIDFKTNNELEDLTFSSISRIQKNNVGVLTGVHFQKDLTKQLTLKIGAEAKYQCSAINTSTIQKLYPWSIGLKAALVFSRL
ncbi:MAG: hypothetical protein ACERKD_21980 [Prolixibacteraceae bacterium]